MRHEEILKREDGTSYKISVQFAQFSWDEMKYKVNVEFRLKNKRKWLKLPDSLSDWDLRELSLEDRALHRDNNFLNFVTKEEIKSAKLELWNSIKPS